VSDPLEDAPTGTRPARDGARGGATPTPSSGASRLASDQARARFAPGATVAGRYRIVGLLGRGGMGEVYRADDLTLEQPVALKFLPESVEGDAERLARFYAEARLARQVTHPAVCRVHDIGEVDGHVFLSMEFVDGEDLSSLRKRIGRLSSDKAVEIARQVCAGLHAAHTRGVLHRDLKPGNVMIDGEGHARIADFGLAGMAEAIQADDVRSGTPAYMAPEQLEGREVTQRSDIYSLGLLLYELVTGRRAFDGRTLAEVMRQRSEPPPRPSSLVPDLDPRVEAAILRCLERDPRLRPGSALAVAAALPGGDPLASLLAEGHTPSPEMVAQAGAAEGRVPGWLATTQLGVVLSALLLVPWLAARAQLVGHVPLEKAPAVLEDRAREIVRRLGYDTAPADTAVGLSVDRAYLDHVRERDASPGRWDGLRSGAPPVLQFWYRQSPQLLVPLGASGRVLWKDPPLVVSGMVSLRLDGRGRLVSFLAVPLQQDAADADAEPPAADFGSLFEAAGLEPASFRPTQPTWTPPSFADRRAAFLGHWPERPDLPLRIEAASWRGRPVAFEPVGAWTRPERDAPRRVARPLEASAVLFALLFVGLFVAAVLLARANVRAGRADRSGAVRVALATLLLGLSAWAVRAHHVGLNVDELGLWIDGLGRALTMAFILWLFYVALEPFVRRHWPHALISWTRLLVHGPGDPLVARDLLAGLATGALVALDLVVGLRLPGWLGGAPSQPLGGEGLATLLGLRFSLHLLLLTPLAAAGLAMGSFLLLVLLRFLLKREAVAATVLVLVVGTLNGLRWDLPLAWGLPLSLLVMATFVLVALRFGLLAFVVAATVTDLWLQNPLSTELSGFKGQPTLFVSAVLLAASLWAFSRVLRAPPECA